MRRAPRCSLPTSTAAHLFDRRPLHPEQARLERPDAVAQFGRALELELACRLAHLLAERGDARFKLGRPAAVDAEISGRWGCQPADDLLAAVE